MKSDRKSGWIYGICAFLFVMAVWNLLTLYFPPMVVPRIGSVASCLLTISTSMKLRGMILLTVGRLAAGLSMGVALGLAIGVLMGNFRHIRGILMPLIGVLQTVPPVSWVVLALVWLGFNGKPVIFIVVTTTLPVIAIHVSEGIQNVDPGLLEMARLYRFSVKKQFLHVVFPSILPYFSSAFRVALGSGWKIAVMGEVLTTSDGIGGMVKLARLNIEPESIIAWSVVIVVLFYASDFILARLAFIGKVVRHADGGTHKLQL